MKKLIVISGVMIVASHLFSSCGGTNQEKKGNALKDSLEVVKKENLDLQAKLDSLINLNSLGSPKNVNAINEILGEYISREEYYVEHAESNVPQGPIMTITISKEKNKIILTQIYQGDEGYGCSGPHTEASAELLGIEKVDDGIYEMKIQKLKCHYTEAMGCDDIDISETTPKNNSDFIMRLDLTNKSKIKFSSDSKKTKCSHAWDFRKLTFTKK